jgi:hypothetical protein
VRARAAQTAGDKGKINAMANVETRQVDRDSLLLLAQVRVDGSETVHRVKVRNLSAGGMMAEGALPVVRGSLLSIELRNIGWIDGSVAWKQDDRFGIAFVHEIDPKIARAPVGTVATDLSSPRFTRPPIDLHTANLRKI